MHSHSITMKYTQLMRTPSKYSWNCGILEKSWTQPADKSWVGRYSAELLKSNVDLSPTPQEWFPFPEVTSWNICPSLDSEMFVHTWIANVTSNVRFITKKSWHFGFDSISRMSAFFWRFFHCRRHRCCELNSLVIRPYNICKLKLFQWSLWCVGRLCDAL